MILYCIFTSINSLLTRETKKKTNNLYLYVKHFQCRYYYKFKINFISKMLLNSNKTFLLFIILLFSRFVRGQATPTFSNWLNFNGSEEIKKFDKRHFMHLTNFKFTRQLISFFRHQSFLLFSLLFVVSSGTLFSQGSVVTWGYSLSLIHI